MKKPDKGIKQQSIDEAKALLPGLIERRNIVLQELNELNQRVQALTFYLNAFGEGVQPQVAGAGSQQAVAPGISQQIPGTPFMINIGPPFQQTMQGPPPTISTSPIKAPAGRAKKGAVYLHVDAILQTGKKLKASEISQAIAHQFAVEYGPTSIHRALTEGKKTGRYTYRDGRWQRAGAPT